MERLKCPRSNRSGAFAIIGVMDDYGRPGNEKYAAERKALQERFPEGPYWRGIDIGDGWMPIVIELDQRLLELYPDYKIAQVKEKFGTLRFYVEGIPYYEEGTQELTEGTKLIGEAEGKTMTTCENCGAPGVPRYGGWVKTLCDDCDKERTRRRGSSS